MVEAEPSAKAQSQEQHSNASRALWQLLASQFGLGGDLIESLPVAAMSPEKVALALYVLQTYCKDVLFLVCAFLLLVCIIIPLTSGVIRTSSSRDACIVDNLYENKIPGQV